MGEENNQLYYYHGDHLGSAQLVTDPEGEIYEQLEYTPYGELWVEHLKPTIEATPFRFTGKERDSETGLYYFGARYLNPQTGMWLSVDPAMGEYIPQAPINDEAKQHNKELPGMGGVFNYVNLHTYHYAGNNPVKYIDPDGDALWIPLIIAAVAVSTLVRSDVSKSTPINRVAILSKVGGIANLYNDGRPGGLTLSSAHTIKTTKSVTLGRNPVAAIGHSMPRGTPQPSDYNRDGYGSSSIINSTPIDAKMGGLGLANSMLENLTDGRGHMLGDIRLECTKSDGRLTSWSIIETVFDPLSGNLKDDFYTKEQALEFLRKNNDRFSDKTYREICNKLGLD
jgi:RHS repeat-associated protein